jgi:hypothetical protein
MNKNIQPSNYKLHSGGAKGSDITWSLIGHEFGLTEFNHYWYKKKNPYSKIEDEISEEDYQEGILKIHEINDKILKRNNIDKYMHLLSRNWCQIKYSDSTYAISTITNNKVNGGTGYATHISILHDHPTYVFDQEKEQWYFWNNNKFEVCVTPRLSLNFAGIGTRKINDAGIKAIRNVYIRTFNKIK